MRLGLVGEQLVLTGHTADAAESRAILDLVHACAAGHRVVSYLRIRGQLLLHVLALEVDRRAAAGIGLRAANGVGDQVQTAAAIEALCSRRQGAVVAAQSIPASEGQTALFTARRCQVTLIATTSSDTLGLAVSARFSPSGRSGLEQSLQTVVGLRPAETLVLTSYGTANERDLVLIVTPEIVGGGK